jgi:protein-L-isoaspartate(D-aspartate) O-methyltransferase
MGSPISDRSSAAGRGVAPLHQLREGFQVDHHGPMNPDELWTAPGGGPILPGVRDALPRVVTASLGLLAGASLAAPCQAPDTSRDRGERHAMVELIARRGVTDSATLAAMRAVPRHEFVEASFRGAAYGDHPLPIGHDQTISQPYIVAYMTELLRPRPGMRVLEVGTGSGYQAAVLAAAGCDVYSVEILAPLADAARERLRRLGYDAIRVRVSDGYLGWPAAAPFDAVIVTAAAPSVPPALVDQLARGGRMVIPTGRAGGAQWLQLVTKDHAGRVRTERLAPVRFVPLVPAPSPPVLDPRSVPFARPRQ